MPVDLVADSSSVSAFPTTPELLFLGWPARGVYTLGAPLEAPRGRHIASIRAGARTETGRLTRYEHLSRLGAHSASLITPAAPLSY